MDIPAKVAPYWVRLAFEMIDPMSCCGLQDTPMNYTAPKNIAKLKKKTSLHQDFRSGNANRQIMDYIWVPVCPEEFAFYEDRPDRAKRPPRTRTFCVEMKGEFRRRPPRPWGTKRPVADREKILAEKFHNKYVTHLRHPSL
jgi:hypothetical protein